MKHLFLSCLLATGLVNISQAQARIGNTESDIRQEFSHYTENTVLYGPLCMNIDVVRENATLPPLKRGDQVVVHRVGAYNITQSMQFISLRPAIVMIDMNGKSHKVKSSETLATVESNEILPDYLKAFKL